MENFVTLLKNRYPAYINNFKVMEVFEAEDGLRTTSEYVLPFTIIELFKEEIKKSKIK